jgi:transposase-like protein
MRPTLTLPVSGNTCTAQSPRVDKGGDTVDFHLTAKRDLAAARRYLERAIDLHGLPERTTIDKSGANTAAIRSINEDACLDIDFAPIQIPERLG